MTANVRACMYKEEPPRQKEDGKGGGGMAGGLGHSNSEMPLAMTNVTKQQWSGDLTGGRSVRRGN